MNETSPTTVPAAEHRPFTAAEFASALRQVADFYEAHPTCPVPYLGDIMQGELPIYSVHGLKDLRNVGRHFGTFTKHADSTFYSICKTFGCLTLAAKDFKANTCTRTVVGTKTVTKQVPLTFEEVTEQEEIVEWRCPETLIAPAVETVNTVE